MHPGTGESCEDIACSECLETRAKTKGVRTIHANSTGHSERTANPETLGSIRSSPSVLPDTSQSKRVVRVELGERAEVSVIDEPARLVHDVQGEQHLPRHTFAPKPALPLHSFSLLRRLAIAPFG